jgi:IclR family acetate operon transcriptional repressor
MDDFSASMKPLALLELIASSDRAMSLADMTLALGLPKPTLHRWLATLQATDLVQKCPDGRRFELGTRASQLAFLILSNRPSATLRHEILERVVREVGEACNLTVLQGATVFYLDRVESNWPLRITFQRGSKVPVHCSASGKLFLGLMQPAKREAMMRELILTKHTPNTLTTRSELLKELATIHKQRYALDREEFLSGLVCLAVPIFKTVRRAKSCVAALAIQAPVTRLSCDQMLKKLPVLQAAAQGISATFE